MEEIYDTLLGFLPYRGVFFIALGTSILILIIDFGFRKIQKWTELPYMQQKNQFERLQIQKQMMNERQKDNNK